MSRLVFLDTETTGLADECDIWEIGLIVRNGEDQEYAWQVRPDLHMAEPTGLRIGHYYDRIDERLISGPTGTATATVHPYPTDQLVNSGGVAGTVARLLDGATLVGAVPDFDARHLTRWLRANGQCGTWHYHLVDVETLAAGRLQMEPPWNFDRLLAAYGLVYDEAERHTALGDTRMVRDLYDAVMGTASTPSQDPDGSSPTT